MANKQRVDTERLAREARRLVAMLDVDNQKRLAGSVGRLSQAKRDALEKHAKQVARRFREVLGQSVPAERETSVRVKKRSVSGTKQNTSAGHGSSIARSPTSVDLSELQQERINERAKHAGQATVAVLHQMTQEEIKDRDKAAVEMRSIDPLAGPRPRVDHIVRHFRLPPDEVLDSKLVPATALEAFDAARADEQRWFSVSSGLAGVVVGSMSQIAMLGVDSIPVSFWFVVGLLSVMIALTGWQTVIYHRRVEKARQELEW